MNKLVIIMIVFAGLISSCEETVEYNYRLSDADIQTLNIENGAEIKYSFKFQNKEFGTYKIFETARSGGYLDTLYEGDTLFYIMSKNASTDPLKYSDPRKNPKDFIIVNKNVSSGLMYIGNTRLATLKRNDPFNYSYYDKGQLSWEDSVFFISKFYHYTAVDSFRPKDKYGYDFFTKSVYGEIVPAAVQKIWSQKAFPLRVWEILEDTAVVVYANFLALQKSDLYTLMGDSVIDFNYSVQREQFKPEYQSGNTTSNEDYIRYSYRSKLTGKVEYIDYVYSGSAGLTFSRYILNGNVFKTLFRFPVSEGNAAPEIYGDGDQEEGIYFIEENVSHNGYDNVLRFKTMITGLDIFNEPKARFFEIFFVKGKGVIEQIEYNNKSEDKIVSNLLLY